MVHLDRISHALTKLQPTTVWLWRRSNLRSLALSVAVRIWSVLLTMGEHKAKHRRSP